MIGASARIPSGPVAHDRPHKQAGHMTAPTSRQKDAANPLRNGGRPHMTPGLGDAASSIGPTNFKIGTPAQGFSGSKRPHSEARPAGPGLQGRGSAVTLPIAR